MTDLIPSLEYHPLAPEDMEIANTYLETMDMNETAQRLSISIHQVSDYINKPTVQKYLTEVFMDTGYRNRFKLGKLLDDIIDKKLEELEEAGITSSKDIMEILDMVFKIRKMEIDSAIRLEEIRLGKPKRQTNIQINNPGADPYQDFTKKLLDLDDLK
jgi:DNA-binding CsgD family transcriptional regulator